MRAVRLRCFLGRLSYERHWGNRHDVITSIERTHVVLRLRAVIELTSCYSVIIADLGKLGLLNGHFDHIAIASA